MFGHMLCYLISTLITNNAGVGFYFQNLVESVPLLRIALMIASRRLCWMWWVCNSGYLICFLICLIEFSLSVAIKMK